jgi:glycine hydroxymethyltransferase
VIDKAVFPTSQGGAINHQIAGKALCFKQAGSREFAEYASQIVSNAAALSSTMMDLGLRVISGGTENHMFLADLRSLDEDLTGKEAATLLDAMGITLNRNAIPFDPRSPFVTSGIRMGTAAVTTAGMKQEEMATLGSAIVEILRDRDDARALEQHGAVVGDLAAAFPAYPFGFNGYV